MSVLAAEFRQRVEASRKAREDVRANVDAGHPLDAEPDQNRVGEYMSRQIAMNLPGAEALVGSSNDLQAIWFLVRGAQVRRAVAIVEVNLPNASERGTGFMISPHLFMTNQHVIQDAASAKATQIAFDFERDERGLPLPQTIYQLDPDRLALFSPETELDYAIIALGSRLQGEANVADLGYCTLSNRSDKHAIGMNVNIIQHPSGLPKMVALRNNILTYRTSRTLLYETDTESGSSGSPVFNDFWELVALHHFGAPFLELRDEAGKPIPKNVNEGVRVSSIYADLAAKIQNLSGPKRALLREALADDKQGAPAPGVHVLTPPRAATPAAESAAIIGVSAMPNYANEMRITVPVEVTVRVGGQSADIKTLATAAAPAKTLTSAAEALHIDQNYDSRKGYDSKFIAGVTIPLPTPNATLAKQVASLHSDQPAGAGGELKYEHFSVKLNKSKQIAIFTATNIDGKTFLNVDRATGQVSGAEEGDKWFLDPRVDSGFYLGQAFYGEWSDYFDRGHLTRRTDPTWGTPEIAERANADTFHFTNCSPQHFRFNESAKFWQGAERYVLENGVLASDSKTHITVFQGPIFNTQIDLSAGPVQIPSSFFKVIVWKGKSGLKSVGLVVDQLALLSETRKSLGQPKDLPSVNVTHWRVSIATIEQRTGLSFGKAVNDADTIKSSAQPVVGEAIIVIKSFEDLLPKQS